MVEIYDDSYDLPHRSKTGPVRNISDMKTLFFYLFFCTLTRNDSRPGITKGTSLSPLGPSLSVCVRFTPDASHLQDPPRRAGETVYWLETRLYPFGVRVYERLPGTSVRYFNVFLGISRVQVLDLRRASFVYEYKKQGDPKLETLQPVLLH